MGIETLTAAAWAGGITVAVVVALVLRRVLGRRLPPGPRGWPVVGNLLEIEPVQCRCYAEWAGKYGAIMSVWVGSTLNVVVSSVELAREVLKDNDQQLADRPRNRATAAFSGDGKDLIWADYGPHYVKVRKVCTLELFSPRRLEVLRPIREDEVTAMVQALYRDCIHPEKKGRSLVVREYLAAVAFNNITRLAFGKRFVDDEGTVDEQGQELKAIGTEGVKLAVSMAMAMAEHIPWLRWMFPLEEEAFSRHNARRDRLTTAILDEHTRIRRDSGGAAKQHFVDALLTLQKKYDLSDDTVTGLLWDMITAGMDTTVIVVEWAMAEVITGQPTKRQGRTAPAMHLVRSPALSPQPAW